MKRFLALLTVLGILFVTPAWAMDLHSARADGTLGEKTDGYVAVLKKSPEAQALADEVNAKRKAAYAKISAANNQPVEIVAKLAAPQIVAKLEAGDHYQAADGSWKTK
jgi:uncharacterized protein YdbL (DUF1318 family)